MTATATGTTTAVRALTPRLRVAVRIIAGRGLARACMQVSMLALLPVWGAEQFGPYVAATGAFNWLTALVQGTEKAALTGLPRAPVLAHQLTRMLVGRAAAPVAVAAVLAVALLPVGGAWALYPAAAVYAGSQGLMSVLASLHRIDGHAGRETTAYVVFAMWVIILAGFAFAGALHPYQYLLGLVTGQLVVCAVLALAVPRLRSRPARVRAGRVLRRRVDRRVFLLGISEVASTAGVAVLYVVIASTGTPADAATVYVVMVISSVFGSLSVLVLRLLQPGTSMRLRGTGGRSGRQRAAAINAWATALAGIALAVGLAVVVFAAAVGGAGAVAAIAASTLALGLAIAVEMVLFCVVLYTIFLLENTNGVALRLTSTAAWVGLAATTVSGLVLVPALHAVGAVVAMVVGLVGRSVLIRLWLRREAGAAAPRP
ncbi:hypothetical protein [Labedaea rhizosphaerae]|uniref:O-antigen/teichoic acid export membrane protein n=1 Tax=Labedaea rhizosphaerae TaxID=598644 RepID=A0A4R6S573_LABRH|nr:hypothetical protein [Labedaea rhizosphaerae]TDP93896.1 hypothetical protein EV186_106290 [Labedaea rhizosphaerae]